jgi:hypothetical protein
MGSPVCYPGADAGIEEVIRLAHHYRRAANDLLRLAGEKGRARVAPCRLCAVHAIELYLNAFLLKLGHPPERIRDSRHDLAVRAALANAGGLGLRRRTAIHLAAMTQDREYLVLRYDPGMAELSPLNRLWATLDEIARKVTRAVAPPGLP